MEFSFKNNLIKVGHGFTISCHVVEMGPSTAGRHGEIVVVLCRFVFVLL